MILIVAERLDPHVEFVEPLLDERGIPWVRLHLSDFPSTILGTYAVGATDIRDQLVLSVGTVFLDDVRAVWYRRPERPQFPPSLDGGDLELAQAESSSFIQGLWSMLSGARWVSAPHDIRRASHKVEQLVRARKIGFVTPATCVSNDSQSIRKFFETHGGSGRIIYKPHNPIMLDRNDGRVGVVYTTLLSDEDMEKLQDVRYTPGIFQSHVPKQCDVRVTVFGDDVFACAIESQDNSLTSVDWRAHSWERPETMPRHNVLELPGRIADLCRALVKSYSLEYGAIDLVLTPEQDYVFLEMNPNGQWAWVEQLTGSPMREALVNLLAV